MCICIDSGLGVRLYEVENVIIAVGIFFFLHLNLPDVRFQLLLLLLHHLGLDSCFFISFCDSRLMRFSIHNPINLLLLILLICLLSINFHSIALAYTNLLLAISIIAIISISIDLSPLAIIATRLHPLAFHLPQNAPNKLLHPPPLEPQHIVNLPLHPLVHLLLPLHHSIKQ